jgi:hypothetical protein
MLENKEMAGNGFGEMGNGGYIYKRVVCNGTNTIADCNLSKHKHVKQDKYTYHVKNYSICDILNFSNFLSNYY